MFSSVKKTVRFRTSDSQPEFLQPTSQLILHFEINVLSYPKWTRIVHNILENSSPGNYTNQLSSYSPKCSRIFHNVLENSNPGNYTNQFLSDYLKCTRIFHNIIDNSSPGGNSKIYFCHIILNVSEYFWTFYRFLFPQILIILYLFVR